MFRSILCLVVALTLTGCAKLVLKEDDSMGEKTGKVVTRILLGVGTLGLSELDIRNARDQVAVHEGLVSYCDSLNQQVQARTLTIDQAESLLQGRVDYANQIEGKMGASEFLIRFGSALSMAGQGFQGGPVSQPYDPPRSPLIHCTARRVLNKLDVVCD